MILLDPDMNGCTVWCINSVFDNHVTRIKGTPEEIVNRIVDNMGVYINSKDQWGNDYRELVICDFVYIDNNPLSRVYIDLFTRKDLYIQTLPTKSSNTFFPERSE